MTRVNRCVELFAQAQPVYYTGVAELSRAAGLELAGTWADYLTIDFEHHSLDITGLAAFMRGLKDAGPTRSGHPTPAVICTLPANGLSAQEILANGWQIRHLLATGIHGLLLCHARDPEAVRAFVESARYPFQTLGIGDALGEGRRGAGGQGAAAEIWGLTPSDYVRRADPWPLNPEGELLLGLKIEDRHCVLTAGACAAVPGLAFAEWGPGDMGMSLGYSDRHDPPYPPEMDRAREAVKAACDRAGLAFLSGWNDPSMTPDRKAAFLINNIGARMISGPEGEALAAAGRKLTGRTLPV